MALHVLYVEDENGQYDLLEEAVTARNQSTPDSAQVVLSRACNPDELESVLELSTDVVMADVCFVGVDGTEANRLDDILRIVTEWESSHSRGRPLPVIALTGKGKEYVEFCLNRKESLYDVWDKGAASPEYRAWRLSRLAAELPRVRPDALIQCLVSQMPSGASWHSDVVDMVRRYDSGRTEADQVEKAGHSVLL